MDLSDQEFIDRGRVYIHQKCGQPTRVNEHHFVGLCNPLQPCARTWCVHCEVFAPLKEVSWENTGESLLDYRKRLRRQIPQFWKSWGGGLAALAGAVPGAIIGLIIGEGPVIVIGALLGAIAVYLLRVHIMNLFVDTRFYRKK